MYTHEELTLSQLRKACKGKHLDLSKFDAGTYTEANHPEKGVLHYGITTDDYDYFEYVFVIRLNPDGTINQLGRLYKQQLVGDDAVRVDYRDRRVSKEDYAELYRRLKVTFTDSE